MTSAVVTDPMELTLGYSKAINASLLDPTAFVSSLGPQGVTIDQTGPTEIVITFDGVLASPATITYTGTTPGILTPDEIDI